MTTWLVPATWTSCLAALLATWLPCWPAAAFPALHCTWRNSWIVRTIRVQQARCVATIWPCRAPHPHSDYPACTCCNACPPAALARGAFSAARAPSACFIMQGQLLEQAIRLYLTELAAVAFAAAAASLAASGAPSRLAAQLKQAARRLRDRPQESLSNAQETERLLQQAAALMQQYYASPTVAAERQLALAQAAAGRSCAYLRCTNLGGEGGPAAGQGVGGMRCRWAGRVKQAGGWNREQQAEACCCASATHALTPAFCAPYAILPLRCTVLAARCGTAAPPARTPTGGRAGTTACARRWAWPGGRPRRQRRRRRRQRRRRMNSSSIVCCLI